MGTVTSKGDLKESRGKVATPLPLSSRPQYIGLHHDQGGPQRQRNQEAHREEHYPRRSRPRRARRIAHFRANLRPHAVNPYAGLTAGSQRHAGESDE